jgi:hypothetical protein
MSLEEVLSTSSDLERLTQQATRLYTQSIEMLSPILDDIRSRRMQRRIIPASLVWRVGDMVFSLKADLSRLDLEIDGLYEHLMRDLGVKRKWLEKAIILRRYVPDVAAIPENASWGSFEKGTRRSAERAARAFSPND